MSTTSIFEDVTSLRNAAVPRVVVQTTDVGYDVRTEAPIDDRAMLIERVAAIAGLAIVSMALAGIYVGRAYHVQGLGAGPLVAGAVLLTGGVAYLWISARGIRHQTNVDLAKRELHYVARNRLNSTRVLRTVRFNDIKATFVEPASAPGKPARLFVRVGTGDDLLEITRGTQAEVEELHDRLRRDLAEAQ